MIDKNNKSILDYVAGDGYILIWFSNKTYFDEEVSTNCITFLRPGLDIICLPKNEKNQIVFNWAISLFKYSKDQFCFYEEFSNEEEQQQISIIEQIILKYSEKKIKFFPLHTNLILNEVASKFNIEVINDNKWQLPDKRWPHQNIPGTTNTNTSSTYKFPIGVNVPKGYIIYSIEELETAKNLLEEKEINKFIIKNVYGYGGGYLWPCRTESEYEIAKSEMDFKTTLGFSQPPCYIIEEMIEYDVTGRDEGTSPIVHYVGDILCPGVYHQNFFEFAYIGMNSLISKYEGECIRQAELIKDSLKLKGPWGIDFVTDRNGKAYVIDINYGRVCGSHFFRFFYSLYGKGKFFDSWIYGNIENIIEFYEELRKHKLDFNFEIGRGVMPMRVMDPNKACIMVLGDSFEDIQQIRKDFNKILKNGISDRYTLNISSDL